MTAENNHVMPMSRTFRLVYLALLIAQSLALFLFEGLLPLPFLAPGAKLGLANIITLLALYTVPARDALLVLLIRVLLATMFGGGPTILAYSLAGGLLSFAAMLLLKKMSRHVATLSIVGVSAAGGFAHNVGQLLIAALVIESPGILFYLPILGPCGLLTGSLIGLAGGWTLRRLPARLRQI